MSGIVPNLALLVCVLAVAVAVAARRGRALETGHGEAVAGARAAAALEAARHRVDLWRWAGLAAGVAAAWWTAETGTLGRGPMLAPAAFGLTAVAGVLAGEMSVRPPSQGERSAALRVRRLRDYVPPRLGAVVGVTSAGLLALLAATTAAASPDDMGRAGRALAGSCSAATSWARGPWPGSYYSVPLGALVVVGLVAGMAVLVRVAGRPRVGGSAELVGADEALRHRAGETVTAACGVLVAAPFIGIAGVTAMTLQSDCEPAWWGVARAGLLAGIPLLLVVLSWCVAVLLSPSGRPARRRVAP